MKELELLTAELTKRTKFTAKVMDLPRNLVTAQVLFKAHAEGIIDFGRPAYSETRRITNKEEMEKESDKVVEPKYDTTLTLDKDGKGEPQISWFAPLKPNRMTVPELLAEEDELPAERRKQIGLLVRLTANGADYMKKVA